MKINWDIVSKYRNELFGVATVLVILTHTVGYTWEGTVGNIMVKLCNQGSIGVDIFLFLSGMGLYHSLKKDHNIRNFYMKRVKRILIPYICLGVPAILILDLAVRHTTIGKCIMDISTLSFWVQGDGLLWYVPFIMVLYLIFPIIFSLLMEKGKTDYKLILCFIFSCMVNVWLFCKASELCDRFEIALSRFPIFILGCQAGRKVYDKRDLSVWIPTGAMVIFLLMKVVLACIHGSVSDRVDLEITRVSFWIGTYAIIFLVPVILEKIQPRRINKALRWMGGLSLEIYMVHRLLQYIYWDWPMRRYNSPVIYFGVIIPTSLLIVRAYEMARNKFSEKCFTEKERLHE